LKNNFTDPSKLTTLRTSQLYWLLIILSGKKTKVEPVCISKWEVIYDIEDHEWRNIFRLPFYTCRSTKLQTFQYRLLHRVITCNHWLFNAQIKSSPNCDACQADDTIEHFFLHCENVKLFWKRFHTWWNKVAVGKFQLDIVTEKDTIFGIKSANKYSTIFNYVAILAKKHIHDAKLTSGTVYFLPFLVLLKQQVILEREIAYKNRRELSFDSNWKWLLDEL
jgi:hypothetical protein